MVFVLETGYSKLTGFVNDEEWKPGSRGLCEYVIVRTSLGGSPISQWISLGGKPKWLPLKFWYHDVMSTSSITLSIPIGCFFSLLAGESPQAYATNRDDG